jgi:hypothetical protein
VSQLNDEGIHVPAFTFEKISPEKISSTPSGSIQPVAAAGSSVIRKQRSVIVQMLDRFVEARVRRVLRGENGVTARRDTKPRD